MAFAEKHYQTVAQAIHYLRQHATEQPELSDLAEQVGLSPQHLQRAFSAWAGISPKRFLQFLTKEAIKDRLRQSRDVLSAALDAGLSGPGRAHDLMVQCEAVTPGEYGALGEGLTITYGVAGSPFGTVLVGVTGRGVCHLQFLDGLEIGSAVSGLQAEWPKAELVRDDRVVAEFTQRIFGVLQQQQPLSVLLKGTNFQIKVWEALLRLDSGLLASYGDVADLAGSAHAQRAVGSALAANRIAYLIPCHRVIRESGEVGNYRWDATRKTAMIGWEQAKAG